MRTPVVVLDEPTTGQDARGVERVAAIVEQLGADPVEKGQEAS